VGIVGVNGAGKTSVLNLLSGALPPQAGKVRHGRTVALQQLTQELDDLDPEARVLATVEGIRRITRTIDGEVTASSLLERFGFTGDRLTARLGDLSGGERRRFQLLRLLLTEPNVLLLDEPTNDLDIETLNVVEDFLDGWPGTLVVVSHDRYFLERVTDSTWALLGDGQISMLPGGVDDYLARRAAAHAADHAASVALGRSQPAYAAPQARAGSAAERAARKTLERLDKQLARLAEQEAALQAQIAEHASDYARLAALSSELQGLTTSKVELEDQWLRAAELLG
jgi:ATP-binding cassette subfamily F protein uup